MQDLIGRASWDDALVRADVRDFVGRRLGHRDAILVIGETGHLKKGRDTVGVQRQYSGTAGKIENCQLAVHLTYASPLGHALIDVALYLPRSWSDDPQRRAQAGVPEQVGFATNQLARRLIETAAAGGLPCRWVTGDEACGGDPALAAALRQHRFGYVLAVASSHRAPTGLGTHRADQIAAGLPKRAWQRLSAGDGAKGHRYYDWAFVTLPLAADRHDGHHWLLIRRNRTTGELAFYRCWSPKTVALHHLVAVAGRRWSIEDPSKRPRPDSASISTSTADGRPGTVRRRWSSPRTRSSPPRRPSAPSPDGLIAVTVNELRRLFHALVIEPARRIADVIAWSIYRRRHQDAAKTSHYARQSLTEP